MSANKKIYWLAEQTPGFPSKPIPTDGPHDSVQGVIDAKALILGIFGDRGKKYCMITVEPVPEGSAKINKQAMSDCHKLVNGKPL